MLSSNKKYADVLRHIEEGLTVADAVTKVGMSLPWYYQQRKRRNDKSRAMQMVPKDGFVTTVVSLPSGAELMFKTKSVKEISKIFEALQ